MKEIDNQLFLTVQGLNNVLGICHLTINEICRFKSFPAHSKNTTYTWELDTLSGTYVLSLVDGNEVVQSEKILIE